MNLRSYIRQAIASHAFKEYPRESCGLLVADKDKTKYIPCTNLAADDADFRMCPEDYANAEDQYQIIAIVHSHVNLPPTPSEADLVSCEASGLPWHIVSVGKDDDEEEVTVKGWHHFEPSDYVSPLIGRNFHHGVLDCYTLVRDFYKRELEIDIPNFIRPDNWWEDKEGSELYLDNFEKAGFVEVSDGPKYGDVILMMNRSPRTNHAGVFLGENILKEVPDLFPIPNAMLHHNMPRLSERVVYGGPYLQMTRKIVRHKDLL